MGIGIDIGSYNTKLVELNQEKNQTRLNNLGMSKLLPDSIIYEPEKITQNIISTNVKDLVRSNNITSKNHNNAAIGIPASKSIIKYIVKKDQTAIKRI